MTISAQELDYVPVAVMLDVEFRAATLEVRWTTQHLEAFSALTPYPAAYRHGSAETFQSRHKDLAGPTANSPERACRALDRRTMAATAEPSSLGT
eukprot:scaffold420240_cov48-Prasinocladus_malaysianus.AAC.1